MTYLLGASTATEIILTILYILAASGLTFLLIKGIKKENMKYRALNDKNLTMMPDELKQMISREIVTPKRDFALIEVSLNEVENIEKVCGEEQFNEAVQDLLKKLQMILPNDTKFAVFDKECIWIYVAHKLKKEALELMLKDLVKEINKPIVLVGSLNIEFDVNLAALIYDRSLGNIDSVTADLKLTTIVSKKRGPNNAVIFDRSISNISTEEYTLFTEIKQAIKNNDFRIFYQPIVELSTMECFAVEAYLRWQHSVKGIISPDVFMPSLEHSGDINWVGLWAFDAMAKQLEYWRANNPENKTKINVNWSITQLSNPLLHEEVRKVLKKYKIAASDFYFEIPNYKTALTIETAARNINIFRQLGIKIAIDNINLEVDTILELDSHSVHMLKFNRDFMGRMNINDSVVSIAQMIAKNSAAKNILVVGEGVENDEMIENLKTTGIPLAQGYYFSRPKSPSEAMADILLTPWKK